MQTHTLAHTLHISPGPLTHVSVQFPCRYSLMKQMCEHLRRTGGGFHRCVRSRPQGLTATSEFFHRFSCCSCFPGSSWAAHACCEDRHTCSRAWMDPQLMSTPAVLLILRTPWLAAGGRRAHRAQHLCSSLRNQSRNSPPQKKSFQRGNTLRPNQ